MKTEFTVEFNNQNYPAYYIQDKPKAESLIRKLCAGTGIIAGDLETYVLPEWKEAYPKGALSPILGKPRLLQLCTGTGVAVLDLMAIGEIDLKPLFKARPFVFHNMSFDLKMLIQHYGLEEYDIHCTLLMTRLIFHAISAETIAADLGSTIKRVLGVDINKQAGRSDWGIRELTFEQVYYAAQDTVVLYALYEALVPSLAKLKLNDIYTLQRRGQKVLCHIELRGMKIDVEKHRQNISNWRTQLADAEDTLKEMTKLPKITGPTMAGWLSESVDEEVMAGWPRTEKGALQTDAAAFGDYEHLDVVKPFSAYQKAKTLLSSFGLKLIEHINPVTGRIHASYNMGYARTGRLSCSNPNIQNQPSSKEMRGIYIPEEGYSLIDIDYSSIEPRIITELSQDPELLQAYKDGVDLYKMVASKVLGIPVDEVTKANRQYGKICVLSLNYLGGKRTVMKTAKKIGIHITEDEAIALIDNYRKQFPKLYKWQLAKVAQTETSGYVVRSRSGKASKCTEDSYYNVSVNFPVQALAGECMILALVLTSEALKGTGAHLIATVHDEILIECPDAEVEKVARLAETAMEKAYRVLLGDCVTANGIAVAEIGKSWGAAKT